MKRNVNIPNILVNLSPFLMAILTVTTLWSANAERLNAGQMWIPLGFALMVAGLFLLLFWLLKWTSRNAALVASFFTLGFLVWHEAPWVMGIIMIMVLVMGIWSRIYTRIKPFMLVIPALLSVAIVTSLIQGMVIHVSDPNKVESSYPVIAGQQNIYFIIPDRMPSPDAMRESGIDPNEFVAAMRGLGFYVKDDQLSHDPYTPTYEGNLHSTRTMRYLASVLNCGLDIDMNVGYADCKKLIAYPEVFDILHDRGYTITNIAPWFNESSFFPTADHNLRFQDITLLERLFAEELSLAFFNRTLLAGLNFRELQSQSSLASVESARHQWQADNLIAIAAGTDTSQFVMAHIMLPHEPFIYTNSDNQVDQYYDQIRYTFDYLLDLAFNIRFDDPKAIIIIQSDEGMAYRKPVELNYDLTNTQWNGVFTAWYIPNNMGDLSGIQHTDILDYILNH